MDRFLMLNFVARYEGEQIQTCQRDDKFIMIVPGHMFLIKKENDGSVLTTESYKNSNKINITKYYKNTK